MPWWMWALIILVALLAAVWFLTRGVSAPDSERALDSRRDLRGGGDGDDAAGIAHG